MGNPITLFGSTSQAFQQTSFRGMSGFFTVPTGWFLKPNPNNTAEMIASPNSDYAAPVHYCSLDDSMQNWCFQDLLLSKYLGIQ